jgi:hypothetical protein
MTNASSFQRALLSLGALLVGAPAIAAQSAPMVCSVVSGLECDDSLNCQPPLELRDLPPPTFIHVDVEGGVITLLAPESRRGEQTTIGTATRQEGQTILTGAEAGRGWSMVISDDDLDMSLTMTEDGTGFVVFGACIPEDRVTP